MAKHGKRLPLRRQRDGVEDALLIRSAESLGRMIGALQRQLDGASKKISGTSAMKLFGVDGRENGHTPSAAKAADSARKPARRRAAAKGGSTSGATTVQSTTDRTSKRASKSAAAKKTAGRSRPGASRKTSKSGRSR